MPHLAWAWPYAGLAILLLVPLLLFKKQRQDNLLLSPMALALSKIATGYRRGRDRSWPWLFIIMWLFLCLAIMRPQLVGDAIEISREGRNIMMVLDLSESMEAQDMTIDNRHVDRLTLAKDVMTDFITRRRGDRLGLVVFGSESFLHAPLSFDHPVIKQFLDDAQIGFAGPKTAIGDALGLALKKLLEEQRGDRIIILLTDGQNNMGALEPRQAAEIAQKHNVKIYIVGLGASSMLVDGFFGPTRINPSASLDEAEAELREIAQSTKAKYYRAKDHASLSSIYSEIDQLEPNQTDPLVMIPRKEIFYWPAALAVAMLLLMWARSQIPRGERR